MWMALNNIRPAANVAFQWFDGQSDLVQLLVAGAFLSAAALVAWFPVEWIDRVLAKPLVLSDRFEEVR